MTTKQIALSILGIGTVGGIAGGSYALFKSKEIPKPKSLRQILTDERVIFIGDTQTTEWGKLVTKFLASDTTVTKINATGIAQANPPSDNSANIAKLKEACNNLLEKTEDITNKDKNMAKNWCATSSTLLSN